MLKGASAKTSRLLSNLFFLLRSHSVSRLVVHERHVGRGHGQPLQQLLLALVPCHLGHDL